MGETKTSQGRYAIRLPPSTVQRLKERKKPAIRKRIPLADGCYFWLCALFLPQALHHGIALGSAAAPNWDQDA